MGVSTQQSQLWQVSASIALFVTSGPLLVIINKKILRDHALHMPAFVSSLGIIFTSIFTHVMVLIGQVDVKPRGGIRIWRLLPVGISSAGTFMFGNLAYVYLDAGFIQMLKAGTPALLLFMLLCFRIESISPTVAGFVLFMVLGSLLSAAHTPNMNVYGLLVMLASEVCEGGRCVLTQLFLQKLEFSVWDAGYYLAPVTAGSCLLLSLVNELPHVVSEGHLKTIEEVWPLLFASGAVGVAVNFASFLLIKLTSSLLTKLLVAARNAGLVLFFATKGEVYTRVQVVGYLVTLFAFTGYSTAKVMESKQLNKKKEDDIEEEFQEELESLVPDDKDNV
eukprot:gnl/TRDRNA2_/TRDRNA2_150485_c0_seq1.p1 gnl/TRDRNA2_/TRDRNA2_150485_c0~~gnl/TRDRNA2_/TRDRNA2_150485_c0_seq1.p1  ORF type:complete len:335 (-),score=59.19 gnl/TRDRNA2_/TRDRNA2_150485_c0_seq1:115-1119(-)